MTTGRPFECDEGTTLVELLVASSLLVLAIGMFGLSLYISQRAQMTNADYSLANDAAHLAIVEIDRQLRSGYVIDEPTSLSGSADSVKIFTMSNGQARCAIWAIAPLTLAGSLEAQSLYVRTWNPATQTQPTSFGSAGAWRLVAGGLVGANSQSFTVDKTNEAADVFPTLRMVLSLTASDDPGRPDQAVDIRSTFTSRNVPRKADPFSTGTARTACG